MTELIISTGYDLEQTRLSGFNQNTPITLPRLNPKAFPKLASPVNTGNKTQKKHDNTSDPSKSLHILLSISPSQTLF